MNPSPKPSNPVVEATLASPASDVPSTGEAAPIRPPSIVSPGGSSGKSAWPIRFLLPGLIVYLVLAYAARHAGTRLPIVGGEQFLFVLLLTFIAAFLAVFPMMKLLHIRGNTGMPIGIDTSMCGGSAIAVAATVQGAKDEEFSQAISTIFLFSVFAVFPLPPGARRSATIQPLVVRWSAGLVVRS